MLIYIAYIRVQMLMGVYAYAYLRSVHVCVYTCVRVRTGVQEHRYVYVRVFFHIRVNVCACM